MFVKIFEEFKEGFLEVFNSVGSVYQSLLENFSPDSHEHYDYQGKEPLFVEWARQLEDVQLAVGVINLLLKNLGQGPFIASFGWRETRYQTSGGLEWGWVFKGDQNVEFFVRHPHGGAPPKSTLREVLTSQGWIEMETPV